MTFFFRYMPEVIKAGHVYLAKPPLFGLTKGTGNNRKIDYVYDEVALEKKIEEKIAERKAAGTKIDPSQERFKQAGYTAQNRFKGLGEMDAKQLWETTMDPARRILMRVNYDEETETELDLTFTTLMGDKVEPRKEFIEQNAKFVKNLDIT